MPRNSAEAEDSTVEECTAEAEDSTVGECTAEEEDSTEDYMMEEDQTAAGTSSVADTAIGD